MKSSKTSFLRNCISGWNVRAKKSVATMRCGASKMCTFVQISPSLCAAPLSVGRITRLRWTHLLIRSRQKTV